MTKKNYLLFDLVPGICGTYDFHWHHSRSAVLHLHHQQSYTFTNCGATGRLGPTQTQITNTYNSTNLQGLVGSVNGIQTWTVPQTGNYRITVAGAKGGNGRNGSASTPAGAGAIVQGEFNLTSGQVLSIVTGQMGISSTCLIPVVAAAAGVLLLKHLPQHN